MAKLTEKEMEQILQNEIPLESLEVDSGICEFHKENDMKNLGYSKIDTIIETTLEEARNFYDMETEENFPILQ